MILNFGKCRIDFTQSVGRAIPTGATWTQITEPREGTAKLTTNEGADLEAKIEGGEILDSLPGKGSYTFEWEVFVKKGAAAPFNDNDGVVSGEWALRVIPVEDTTCPSIQIDCCVIKASQDYTVNDAWRIKYTAKALKPASGNTVKRIGMGAATPTATAVGATPVDE